ncbi:MAG: LLM class F420-dependent oxidoreductase [Alphaproteobacteria bacterium]
MDFGFGLPTRGPLAVPEDIAALAQAGERLGYAHCTVNDHIVLPRRIDSRYPYSATGEWPGGRVGDWLEPLGLLCYVAGVTERVRLLTSIVVIPYRPALLQAKMLTTVDVLSRGRLTIGCGVGWMEEEFAALGIPFAERGRMADEYVAAFKELWSADDPQFEGEFVRFSDIAFAPKPVQRPHPPFWIGGESPAALRRTARIGDAWYPIGSNPRHPLDTIERYRAGVEVLHRAAGVAGRDPAGITLAYAANWFAGPGEPTDAEGGGRRLLTGPVEALREDVRHLAEAGVRHLVLGLAGASRAEALDRMEAFMRDVAPHA